MELNSTIAKEIINIVGSKGIPPEYGFQYFTEGLEPYLSVIENEYLDSIIKNGGSAFKMVIGVYGGGKTHFLYCVRDLAWKHNFAVSYVTLNPGESPFHQLELVYSTIVKGLTPPLKPEELLSGYEKGIQSFLKSWYATKYNEFSKISKLDEEIKELLRDYVEKLSSFESLSFTRAVKEAFRTLINNRQEDLINICQWLSAEGYDRRIHGKYGILQKIDKTTAFTMIRSLAQWVREIGYSGLIILFDEAERVASLTSKQKELHLNNLREIIDECGHTDFKGVMIFYAVPDENFLEGRTQIYEALKQRVQTVFDELNPTGVKIELEKLEKSETHAIETLKKIGEKLRYIFEVAYNLKFDEKKIKEIIQKNAESAYKERYSDIGYKRLFIQKLISEFNLLRKKEETTKIKI